MEKAKAEVAAFKSGKGCGKVRVSNKRLGG